MAAHHILHVAFRHGPRSRGMFLRFGQAFQPDVYNIAADAIVNETLILAGYALPRPCVGLTTLLADFGQPTGNGPPLLSRLDADALYIQLMHDRGSAGGSRGQSGDDDNAQRADKIRAAAARQGFTADLHSDEASEEGAVPDTPTDWLQRLARAMDEGHRAGRGIGAIGFRLADLPEVRTSWETLLRGLVTRAVTDIPQASYRRPARRWLAMEAQARAEGTPAPVFQPILRRDHQRPRIVVGIDSSGSIDTARLKLFAAQLLAIARRTGAEVHVLVFDQYVRDQRCLRGPDAAADVAMIAFSRDGGTSFVDVMDRAAALDPSIIVILTDLDGPHGDAPANIPVLWAVPALTARRPPFGRVLSMAR